MTFLAPGRRRRRYTSRLSAVAGARREPVWSHRQAKIPSENIRLLRETDVGRRYSPGLMGPAGSAAAYWAGNFSIEQDGHPAPLMSDRGCQCGAFLLFLRDQMKVSLY